MCVCTFVYFIPDFFFSNAKIITKMTALIMAIKTAAIIITIKCQSPAKKN